LPLKNLAASCCIKGATSLMKSKLIGGIVMHLIFTGF